MMFEGRLYDGEGNEIVLKPGYGMAFGKESFMEVPLYEYEAKMIYKPPCNLKTCSCCGEKFNIAMKVIDEKVHDGDAGDGQ